MRRDLAVNVELRETPLAVVRLAGSVDSMTSDSVDQELDAVLDQGYDHLIMDLSELEFMSTRGWSVLVSKIRRVRTRKGAIHLCCLAPEVEDVYKLLEFETLLPRHATLEDALSAVKAAAGARE